jgi:hypothetical protein
MANIIDVLLRLNDQLNPALNTMQGSLVAGVAKGTIFGNAITGAFNLASNAVGGFISSINQGIEAQQSLVMTVGSMATVMSSTYNEAEGLVTKLQGRLANAAATLPGDTEGYISFFRQISDDVGAINKEMNNGVFNTKQYEDEIVNLTSKFQILADQPGLTAAQGTNAFQQILGGTKAEDLGKFEFFKANPSFLNAIQALVKEQGKNLDEMTKPERYKLLVAALDRAVTDETIDKLSKTLGGQLAALKSTILDPTTGVFGLSRDLDLRLEGQQTVINALTESADVLFGGKDSLFSQLMILFDTLGLGFDPMAALYDGIKGVNKQIQRVANIVLLLNSALSTGENQERIVSDLKRRLGSALSDWTNNLAQNIEEGIPLVVGFIKDIIQGAIAVSNFADANIDEGAIMMAIGRGLVKAFQQNFQFDNVGEFGSFIAGNIIATLKNTTPVIAYRFVNYLREAIIEGAVSLVSAYIQNWDSVVTVFSAQFNGLKDGIPASFNIIRTSVTNVILDFKIGILEFFSNLGDVWKNAASQVLNLVPNILGNMVRSLPGGNLIANAIPLVANQSAQNTPVANPNYSIGGRFNGQIPNAADGFLGNLISAFTRESQNMPSGSTPVIANSSEAILNRAQQGQLGRLINQGTRIIKGDVNIGTINFPATSGEMSPQEIVQYVLGTINQEFNNQSRNMLSQLVS